MTSDMLRVVSSRRERFRELKGHKNALESRVRKMAHRSLEIEDTLSHKDSVSEMLADILAVAQKDAVARYESLLTAFCRDVLRQNVDIRLIPGIQRGRPSLDIRAGNGNNEMEDIYDGRGGSISNIISTGLRYIVLARMGEKRRSLMILDEADCWISPVSVRKFAKVINQMSVDMGIQTISVSHHDKTYFDGAHIVTLLYDEMFCRAVPGEHDIHAWEDDEHGIRKITLRNFMSHENTEINLGPHANVIAGPNDSGKSAIVRAIRAISYNSGADDMVRHGCSECRIELTIEKNMVLSWTRKNKGSQKTAYFLHNASGDELRHTIDGKDVPEWASRLLGIEPVNGLDVQIGHQKRPLFLIDETPARRAEILSIGKDTQYVQMMCTMYAKKCSEEQRELKCLTKDVGKLQYAISRLSAIYSNLDDSECAIDEVMDSLSMAVRSANELNDSMMAIKSSRVAGMHTIGKVEPCEAITSNHILLAATESCKTQISPPVIAAVTKAECPPDWSDVPKMIKSLSARHLNKHIEGVRLNVSIDSMVSASDLLCSTSTLSHGFNVQNVRKVKLPEMHGETGAYKAIHAITGFIDTLGCLDDTLGVEVKAIDKSRNEVDLMSHKDGRCILCGNIDRKA